jgi:hypothetical protein
VFVVDGEPTPAFCISVMIIGELETRFIIALLPGVCKIIHLCRWFWCRVMVGPENFFASMIPMGKPEAAYPGASVSALPGNQKTG